MPKRKAQRGRKRKAQRGHGKRKKQTQLGGGPVSVVAALPKTAWTITKALEKRAKKKADEAHRKRMEEIRQGKRKVYAGESFTCPLM